MAAEIITKEDLQQFGTELLDQIKGMLSANPTTVSKDGRQWVKSYEVRKMLGISNSTLKIMRGNGSVPHTRLGGLYFYSYEHILRLMEPKQALAQRALSKGL